MNNKYGKRLYNLYRIIDKDNATLYRLPADYSGYFKIKEEISAVIIVNNKAMVRRVKVTAIPLSPSPVVLGLFV